MRLLDWYLIRVVVLILWASLILIDLIGIRRLVSLILIGRLLSVRVIELVVVALVLDVVISVVVCHCLCFQNYLSSRVKMNLIIFMGLFELK